MSKSRLSLETFLDRWVYGWTLVLLASLSFSTALMEVASTCALIGWVLLKIKRPGALLFEKKTFFFLAGFVLLSVISYSWSEFPKQSFRGVFKILQQFFVFWVTADTLRSFPRHQRAMQVLVFSMLILGLDGIWQYLWVKDLVRGISFEDASSGPRISGSFKNYGLLASYLVTFLPLIFSEMKKGKGWVEKSPAYWAAAMGLLLLFWTRSRGAWVAFVGGVLFYLWLSKKRTYVILALGLAAGSLLFLPRSMVIHLDSQGQEQSLVERFYLWDRALQVIRAKPWTGTGINTYAVAHQKYDTRQNWRVRNYYSHNGYLQVAAETGLPSLACLLAFLALYFRRALRYLKECAEEERTVLASFLTGLVNFLILCLIDTVLHNPPAVMGFWFLAGWGAGALNLLSSHPAVSCPGD